MHRLELDYASSNSYSRWIGIIMLALATIIGAKLADVFVSVKRESIQLEVRMARDATPKQPRSTTGLSEAMVREIRHANEVIEQLALPWDHLFRAVDSAASDKVALLGLIPDLKSGTVEIDGEAVNLDAMFDYVKRLQRQSSLTRVYLVNQRVNEGDPQRPIHFTVTASWTETPLTL
jgi:hypothetical protein